VIFCTPFYVVAFVYPVSGLYRALLATKSPQPPIGTAWEHEIKHDGIRVIARKTETSPLQPPGQWSHT